MRIAAKVFIPAVLGIMLLASCNNYVGQSLLHTIPNIDDYKFMPYRHVKAHPGTGLPQAADYNKATLPDSLMWSLKHSNSVAFLVFRNDSLVYEWYDRGYSDTSFSNPFSSTKSITGVLTGIALKQGKIKSLDEPICKYYPEFKTNGRDSLTFKSLLTMSSGLNYYDHYLNPFGPLAKLYYGNNVKAVVNHTKQEKTPGTEWRYKNCDPQVITLALQNAVGMNMSDFASQNLWEPIGAQRDALWVVDRQDTAGVEKSYCCFYTNARDIARIGMLYEHDGNWHGTQIVDTQYVKQALTPVNIYNAENKKTQNHYGYLWWLNNTDGMGDFAMMGLKGQYVSVIPSQHLMVVRLGEKEWYKSMLSQNKAHLYRTIIRSVVKEFGNYYTNHTEQSSTE